MKSSFHNHKIIMIIEEYFIYFRYKFFYELTIYYHNVVSVIIIILERNKSFDGIIENPM